MIFYVEDDQEIKELVLYTLKASGFDAKGFTNGEEFFKEANSTKPELILLDIMLPGEDGLSILKRLKSDNNLKDIPVIMATAKGSEYDKVLGLETGADDYLVKPFGMMEMVARIKALLRRSSLGNEKKTVLSNGAIIMDDDRHLVSVNGKYIQLTLKEYDLLKLFLSDVEHVFTRESLLEIIWGMDFIGESRTIDVHVGTLRTKLGKQGNLIETIRGVGYKMRKENEEENI
jgi:two-component system alkaline phosphatase synthesis response regulator PhoP